MTAAGAGRAAGAGVAGTWACCHCETLLCVAGAGEVPDPILIPMMNSLSAEMGS